MRKTIYLTLLALLPVALSAQQLEAYAIYGKDGQKTEFYDMAATLAEYDIVLFGEHHNNALNHWLQLKLTEALYDLKEGALVLGAEMFERDNQEGVDLYLTEQVDAKKLADTVRLWNNFTTDYKPLLDFARLNDLPFVATNIPRRYASIVAKKGLDSLHSIAENEKLYIAQLPITVDLETPGYPEMVAMMKEHSHGMDPMNFVAAQAVKDATMAESILKNMEAGKLFLHYHGDYHSKEYGGIYWYLNKANPELKIAVISVFESDQAALTLPEDDLIPTDFNLVFPEDMAKSY